LAIQPGQFGINADPSKPLVFLFPDLGVAKIHSRPYTSNGNPYSESQFRTMKYRPEVPDRFGCIQDSRAFCQRFFASYNDEHRHSGIVMTPPTWLIPSASFVVPRPPSTSQRGRDQQTPKLR
jgi:hypothetical protein